MMQMMLVCVDRCDARWMSVLEGRWSARCVDDVEVCCQHI